MRHFDLEGLGKVADLAAENENSRNRLIRLIQLFENNKMQTKEEILEKIYKKDWSKKTFEKDVTRLRKIGLLKGKMTEGGYVYYLDYDSYKAYLQKRMKQLREPIYNLLERE